jgi:undecaprenyl-diphosphatase
MGLAKLLGNRQFCLLVIILIMSLWALSVSDDEDHKEFADIFAHTETRIEASQTVGRLLIAGANATIAGRVTEGILVVDGSLIIDNGSVVNGRVIVLGGSAEVQAGATVEHRPWVIAPRGNPLVPVVVSAVLILGAISLIAVPAGIWLSGYFVKKTFWYVAVKKQFFAIQHHWPAVYMVASLGISAMMLFAFSALAWKTIFRNTLAVFDQAFVWLVRYYASPAVDQVMTFISAMGFSNGYLIVVSGVFLLLLYYRHRWEVAALALCLGGGTALNLLLKSAFQRSRPELQIVTETGYSFPSGHAMVSLCFYGMVAFLIMRNLAVWRLRLAVMTVAVLLNVAIGISRIYLGVHYATDVVAGYAAGSMWLSLCISLLMWWEQDRKIEK